MIKKTIILTSINMLLVLAVNSQSLAPQSVNSGGAKVSNSNASLSFTVGELVVLSQTDAQGNTLGGGFTSGSSLTVLSSNNLDASILGVQVYPNPASHSINVQLNTTTTMELVVVVHNMQGQELHKENTVSNGALLTINTTNYPAGFYVLSLYNTQQQFLGSYKIVKQ